MNILPSVIPGLGHRRQRSRNQNTLPLVKVLEKSILKDGWLEKVLACSFVIQSDHCREMLENGFLLLCSILGLIDLHLIFDLHFPPRISYVFSGESKRLDNGESAGSS
jgi:hypothetical protein